MSIIQKGTLGLRDLFIVTEIDPKYFSLITKAMATSAMAISDNGRNAGQNCLLSVTEAF
ncbi:hypothetical protein [Paenibacillus sp. FSL K6-2524]|uniref:hypothetical protein n=1 Tax=Paenibacillus sp. FSL K6-2524 TaxID=2954516 RepID=UPI0030F76DAA